MLFARLLARNSLALADAGKGRSACARKGWMVPTRYWTPGALAPMAIMGKYYMYYGPDFLPRRQLGRMNAERFVQELLMDNLGICRFHRGWAEEMGPETFEAV